MFKQEQPQRLENTEKEDLLWGCDYHSSHTGGPGRPVFKEQHLTASPHLDTDALRESPRRPTRVHCVMWLLSLFIHFFPNKSHENWTHILVIKSCEETKNPHSLSGNGHLSKRWLVCLLSHVHSFSCNGTCSCLKVRRDLWRALLAPKIPSAAHRARPFLSFPWSQLEHLHRSWVIHSLGCFPWHRFEGRQRESSLKLEEECNLCSGSVSDCGLPSVKPCRRSLC